MFYGFIAKVHLVPYNLCLKINFNCNTCKLGKFNYYLFPSAFQCILHGRPINIPTEITAEFVRYAEEIADISYSQSETFSSVCVFRMFIIFKDIILNSLSH